MEFLEKEILNMKEIATVEHLTLTVVKLITVITTQLHSTKDRWSQLEQAMVGVCKNTI